MRGCGSCLAGPPSSLGMPSGHSQEHSHFNLRALGVKVFHSPSFCLFMFGVLKKQKAWKFLTKTNTALSLIHI